MSVSLSKSGRIPVWQFAVRLVLVIAQLLLAYWLGQSGVLFFYQGF
jgi:hypothetical protein